jgi:hypothetical protein
LYLSGTESRFLACPARSVFVVPNDLSRLTNIRWGVRIIKLTFMQISSIFSQMFWLSSRYSFMNICVMNLLTCNSLCTSPFCKRIILFLGSYHVGCKIWGFHGGDYDDYHLLGDDAVWLL